MIKFQNFSIATKISIAVLMLLFPIALLGYFLVDEKKVMIDFTEKEILGEQYIRYAEEALSIINSKNALEHMGEAIDAIKKAETHVTGHFNVSEYATDIIKLMKSAKSEDLHTLSMSIKDLISLVSDHSNITLDPDGDTYFIGDLMVNQAIGVMVTVNKLVLLTKDFNPEQDQINFSITIDKIINYAANISTNIKKSAGFNPAINESLAGLGKEVDVSIEKLIKAANNKNMAAIPNLAEQVEKSLSKLLEMSGSEMERLLNARVDGFYNVIITRLGIASLTVIIGLTIFFLIATSVTKPISMVVKQMERLTWGEINIDVPVTNRKDEIGKLILSLATFRDSAIERENARKIEAERIENENKRSHEIQKITADFESKVKEIVSGVAAASTELTHTAEDVTKMMQKTYDNAKTASDNSTQTSNKVNSVAASAEQMAQAVKEISSQVQRTNMLANDSRQKTIDADDKASLLSVATQKVSEAVTMIANISGQINLLALNATIESARAGEAGKGFAVVASEVKNLATQTNKSLEDVGKVIEEVNAASASIIQALRSIKESVDSVSDASSTIAAAVEEQSATTNEITSNMHSAAQGTKIISTNLESVSHSTSQASAAASQVLSAAQELSRQSEGLNREVGDFLYKIRLA